MPTRILSWEQLCLNADPDFTVNRDHPWVYEMSNGRLFYALYPRYGTAASGEFTLDDPNLGRLDEGNVLG